MLSIYAFGIRRAGKNKPKKFRVFFWKFNLESEKMNERPLSFALKANQTTSEAVEKT